MSRLSVNDVELRYPSQSDRVPYFSVKNDRETKQIRILYNTINDIYFDVAHELQVNGKTQTIACLNSDGTNSAACPFCAHGYNQQIKLYIPVLDLSDNTVKIWTRSKNFVGQLQAIAGRNNPISGVVIEVMRIGAPRDPKTQYILQPISQNDGQTVEALGVTIPDSSRMMRQMDFAQMQNFVNTLEGGSAPSNTYNSYVPNAQPQNNYATPPQNVNIGSEPVRRGTYVPNNSVPQYTNTPAPMPTTPMQGVPTTPTSTPTNSAPVSPQVTVSNGAAFVGFSNPADGDNLPF